MSKHLTNLNPEQLSAVQHTDGPILILAGAGTGKTRVLTRRVANLILNHNVPEDRILAVTFTNKAAGEMRERLHNLLGQQADRIWIATFHSAALRILRKHAPLIGYKNGFVVYDTQDCQNLVKALLKKLGIDSQKYKPGYYLSQIDNLKNNFIAPDEFEPEYYERQQMLAEVYDAYQKELRQANAMDFGDLIFNCLLLLKEHKEVRKLYQRNLKYILVDEFQDTNLIQYEIVRYLSQPEHNLLVVGDDDQSIYAFRGADIRNILTFEKDYPETNVVKLEQNYRSTQNILDAAYAVIAKNKGRKDKKLWTESNSGDKLQLYISADERSEADRIVQQIEALKADKFNYKDIAIFYRTNAQSRAIEEALLRSGIAYKIYGGFKFYERKEVKDVLAYLRLIHNTDDNQALARIINVPRRGIGAQTFSMIMNFAEQNTISLFAAARKLSTDNAKLKAFTEFILEFKQLDHPTPAELIRQILERTKYLNHLNPDDDKDLDRRENIMELVALAEEFTTKNFELGDFLDHIALMTATDTSSGNVEADENNHVSLMTLHLAKGLEYPIVFLSGLEDGLLPHIRSIEANDIAEERRLCYVGITRAMSKLYLSYALERGMASANSSFGYGVYGRSPSRFILDIPDDLLETEGAELLEEDEEEYFDDDIDPEYITSFNQRKKKKKKKDLKDIEDLLLSADDL